MVRITDRKLIVEIDVFPHEVPLETLAHLQNGLLAFVALAAHLTAESSFHHLVTESLHSTSRLLRDLWISNEQMKTLNLPAAEMKKFNIG